MVFLPHVVRAIHETGFRIHVTFNDGTEASVDFEPWLEGPVFEPLKQPATFRKFFIDGGTVSWPNGADIAPETLYEAARSARSTRCSQRRACHPLKDLKCERAAAEARRLGRRNFMAIPEKDWRVLRSVSLTALDRYCARVLEEFAAVMKDTGNSPHDRYLRLFRLLNERNESMASAFDDLRRSTATRRLAAMIDLGVVTDVELNQFSPETRDSATALVEIFWGGRTRRRVR